MAINIDKLDIEIRRNLDIYLANTVEDVKKAVLATAKETVAELKKTSPSDTGDYAKGWAYKRDGKLRGKWRNSMVVYNKTDYQLTHLLEHGHAKATGGRVKAFPHIKKAEDIAKILLFTKLVRALRYGGGWQ